MAMFVMLFIVPVCDPSTTPCCSTILKLLLKYLQIIYSSPTATPGSAELIIHCLYFLVLRFSLHHSVPTTTSRVLGFLNSRLYVVYFVLWRCKRGCDNQGYRCTPAGATRKRLPVVSAVIHVLKLQRSTSSPVARTIKPASISRFPIRYTASFAFASSPQLPGPLQQQLTDES